jgi:hypothetical protein
VSFLRAEPGCSWSAKPQVAALQAWVDAAAGSGGRFVVIEGGAGIGKTRLLAEARTIAGAAGMRVLTARGGELEGEFAFGIVRQLFEPVVASASPDLRAELLSGPAALVGPLFGASRLSASQDAPSEGSFAILLARPHGSLRPSTHATANQPSLTFTVMLGPATGTATVPSTGSGGPPRMDSRQPRVPVQRRLVRCHHHGEGDQREPLVTRTVQQRRQVVAAGVPGVGDPISSPSLPLLSPLFGLTTTDRLGVVEQLSVLNVSAPPRPSAPG